MNGDVSALSVGHRQLFSTVTASSRAEAGRKKIILTAGQFEFIGTKGAK